MWFESSPKGGAGRGRGRALRSSPRSLFARLRLNGGRSARCRPRRHTRPDAESVANGAGMAHDAEMVTARRLSQPMMQRRPRPRQRLRVQPESISDTPSAQGSLKLAYAFGTRPRANLDGWAVDAAGPPGGVLHDPRAHTSLRHAADIGRVPRSDGRGRPRDRWSSRRQHSVCQWRLESGSSCGTTTRCPDPRGNHVVAAGAASTCFSPPTWRTSKPGRAPTSGLRHAGAARVFSGSGRRRFFLGMGVRLPRAGTLRSRTGPRSPRVRRRPRERPSFRRGR